VWYADPIENANVWKKELDAGNRKQVTELGGSYIKWEYDKLYRLKEEKRYNSSNAITWQAGFTYDAAGNRDSMTVNGSTTTYQYNALDQLTSAGAITYGYDARGNLNKITNGTQITNYTYNAADQLSNVVLPNNTNITYGYDADGRRVKQTVGSTVTNYLWDEASLYGDVVLEYNGSGSTLASYVLGGNQLISQTRGSTTSYFLQDGQGSTRALTSSTGTVTDTYAYMAFGESFSRTGTTTNPYQYTGQQFDSLTGLYSLRARYYNPALGRFLSQDTYPVNFNNPVELNRYGYTASNPINLADPTGHTAYPERSILNFFSRQNATTLIKVGIGITAVLLAVNTLVPHVDPKIWEEPKIDVPPLPLPRTMEEIERVGPIEWQRPKPDPEPKPEPTPVETLPPPYYPTPTDTPRPMARVRHYSYNINSIRSEMLIRSTYGLLIWVEYPITTSYEASAIRETVRLFGRDYGRISGFVEFNVDLGKWILKDDENLPGVYNAKVIPLITLDGNYSYVGIGFPLNEPEVNPKFFDETGKALE
jgi:RHS repeat-associated protein